MSPSTGSSSSGSFYSFGSSGNSDRALGQVPSGSTNDMAIGLLLRNTSGVTITSISVSYTLEQWRKGADNSQGLSFTYETSSSIITNLDPNISSGSGWNTVSGLNLNGPISSGPDDVSLNGNSASNRVSVTNVSINGLSLGNGDYIMLRWLDINSIGNDHGLSIDDVTINYTVPSFIFLNDISTNNNSSNPYTTNQLVDTNASASGIGRGPGVDYESENGGYAGNNYTTSSSLDSNDYMYFTITPNVGYQLNFNSFDYQEERTNSDGPEDFSFRSSLDNYGSSILTYNLTNENPNNRSIGLGASQYQNVQSAITFRLFGWDAPGGSSNDREYSINSFAFLGTVTMIPPAVSNTTPTAICNNGSGSVTVTGNNLIHITSVTVGGTPVSIDSKTNTQLVVTVPQGVSGLLTVTNAAGSANGATITLLNAVTYYEDEDGDGFGNPSSSVSNCTGQPVGYVINNSDINDNLVTYIDTDGDGFGSITMAPSGVTNNLDTDDNLVTYIDADGDGFGSIAMAPSGVTNNTDCDDDLLLYEDLDSDGFGSLVLVACGGVTNNTDTNDNLLTYIDSDNDGFGFTTLAPNGVTNNTDCNDANIALFTTYSFYADTDGDGYGAGSLVSVCAVDATTPPTGYSLDNKDCAPTDATKWRSTLLYIDNDGDGYDNGNENVCWGATVPTGYSATTLGNDCDDTNPLRNLTNPCETVVTVKMIIEGYYDADAQAMRPVMMNQGVGSSATDVDTVTIELRDATTYELVASASAMLQTNGNAVATFTTAPSGSFYIVVKHRNALETWSANPVAVGASPSTYDFTTAASQAYGDNMKMLAEGVYGFYSGDINQDGFVEASDFPFLFNDIDNFVEGYHPTDLNGDGFVEASDFPFLFNNIDAFIELLRPY